MSINATRQKLLNNIRAIILKGMSNLDVNPTEEDLDLLELKFYQGIEGKNFTNYRLRVYARAIGFSWGKDTLRKARNALRKKQQEAEAAARYHAEQAQVQTDLARMAKAEIEFRDLLPKLRPTLKGRPLDWLRLVELRIFESKSDADMAALYPASNKWQRQKWLQRGRKLVLESEVSDDLRWALGRPLWEI